MKIDKSFAGFFDGIDMRIANGAFRRGFRIYAVFGAHKRDASQLKLSSLNVAIKKLLKERRVQASDFIKPCTQPLFVGGISGRAGTTWVQDLFREYVNSHVTIREIGVFMLGQFRNAPYEFFQVSNFPKGRAKYIRYFRRFICKWSFFLRREVTDVGPYGLCNVISLRGVKLALNSLEERLESARTYQECQQAFGDFYNWLFNFHAAVAADGKPWISKEPPYGRHADDLFSMIPHAKLLVMARDGRDTALSMHRLGWHRTVREAFDRWRLFTEQTLQALKRCPADQYRMVRYEDLVNNFEERIQEVFVFFELDRPNVAAILKDAVLKPFPASIGLWKKMLSDSDKEYFVNTCSHTMAALGYDM